MTIMVEEGEEGAVVTIAIDDHPLLIIAAAVAAEEGGMSDLAHAPTHQVSILIRLFFTGFKTCALECACDEKGS